MKMPSTILQKQYLFSNLLFLGVSVSENSYFISVYSGVPTGALSTIFVSEFKKCLKMFIFLLVSLAGWQAVVFFFFFQIICVCVCVRTFPAE